MAPLTLTGGPLNLALIATTLCLVYFVGRAFYNLFLHPLRSFPGPISHRAFPLLRSYHLVEGNLPFHVAKLHAKYGPVVRITPDELAFSDPQAWKDIYGHRHNGQEEMAKDDRFYRVIDNIPRGIINERREEHAMLRRQLSHGFSESSLRGQEPIIGSYVDLLIQRLREQCNDGKTSLNMREWLNWTTFDIIGDLGFGSSFGCLDSSSYHPWVKIISQSFKQNAELLALANLGFREPIRWILRTGALTVKKHQALVREKIMQRMELGVERPDFIEGLIKKKDLDMSRMASNAGTLIVAGSETTATLLCGAVFLLTTHPENLQRLVEEVRTSFNSDEEITLTSVSKLTYMLACLNEALRRYPPVPAGLPRVVPKGGAYILDKFVPEGTAVAVWQHAVNHDPHFWTEPQTFAPERFMGDPKFKGDRLDAMQPFSVGPRNCIGRNLAYAEMRLILAKIIYNFDMTIREDSRDWLKNQKAYNLWNKPALNIFMTPVATKG
ncbi:cytochrome P450 ClCP1 [Whalleya microplaca]|nr:cytochrome P450 ClCP1 [Whalleya microplaca]